MRLRATRLFASGGGAHSDPLATMFANGETGGLYSISSSVLYQDAAKTTVAATLDAPVRVITPVYGTGDSVAINDAARPLLKAPGPSQNIKFDLVDDDITVPVTTAGSLFIASTSGMHWGQYDFALDTSIGSPTNNPRFPVVGWCAINRAFLDYEIEALKAYFSARGGVVQMPVDMARYSREMPYTSVGAIDCSVVTGFTASWYICKLASFQYQILQGVTATNYNNAWVNNALNAESVDGILVTIRDNANAHNLLNGTIGLHAGTNAAPTDGTLTGLNGIQAKADLVARGWAVTTN